MCDVTNFNLTKLKRKFLLDQKSCLLLTHLTTSNIPIQLKGVLTYMENCQAKKEGRVIQTCKLT